MGKKNRARKKMSTRERESGGVKKIGHSAEGKKATAIENGDSSSVSEKKDLTIKKRERDDNNDDEERKEMERRSASEPSNIGPSHESDDGNADNESACSDEESSSDEDDLALEGTLIRNPDVPFSSDDDEEEMSSEESGEDEKVESSDEATEEEPARKKSRTAGAGPSDEKNMKKRRDSDSVQKKKKKKSKRKKDAGGPEIVNVEFTFCDMDEKFFHGIKTHLMSNNPIYAPHSSALSDLIIDNVSVGTVLSTDDKESNVFGFASILNVTTNGKEPSIQYLKKLCLKHCPEERKDELETVLSGKTRRPAGLFLHDRMVNLPLEITEVLHQQLILDMDWAVENAEGGEEERKSLDFGAFVRMAPCVPGGGGGTSGPSSVVYKYFDDEVFASNAEFVYTFDAPKTYATEERQLCAVIVMTKTGHRDSMKDMAKLLHGG